MSLDEQGWKDILKVIRDAYNRCEDIEPEAINRTPDPDERFCTTISLLAYESPEKRFRPDVKAIGEAIRTPREEQGLSIAELAKRADTDEATIGLVERGDSISFDLLPSLAAGLKVDSDDVVNLTEEFQAVSVGIAALTGTGLAIKRLRAERHLSQTDLAKKAGLPLDELSLIEAGSVEARWGTLRRLAIALDTDLPQLLQEGEMQQS